MNQNMNDYYIYIVVSLLALVLIVFSNISNQLQLKLRMGSSIGSLSHGSYGAV